MKIRFVTSIACLCATTGILLACGTSMFVKLQNADSKLTASDDIEHSNVASVTSCLALCRETNGCVYISYHEDQDSCFLHQINGVTTVSSTGWNIYFKVLDDNVPTPMDLKDGATASQTTTYNVGFSYTADLAIDGNKNTHLSGFTCAITDGPNSFWIMQFGAPGVVDKVDIYLRSDYVMRNSDRKVWVAQTDNVTSGTVCGSYTGPLIDQTPYILTIECDGPIFGGFLGMQYLGVDDIWEICEVDVFSPCSSC